MAKALALSLSAKKFRKVTWREGARGKLRSHFAAVRVHPAHRDYLRAEPRAEEWLLLEWPEGESAPTKYWLSMLPRWTSLKKLSMLPNCGGGSNATTKNSNRRSGWGIMRGANGAASITMRSCVSPPMPPGHRARPFPPSRGDKVNRAAATIRLSRPCVCNAPIQLRLRLCAQS
jgi:hypothetical protein